MKHPRQPTGYTCPDIDDSIRDVKKALEIVSARLKNIDKYSEEYDNLTDINYWLRDIEPNLEKLRKANETLRTWAVEEAEAYDNLEE